MRGARRISRLCLWVLRRVGNIEKIALALSGGDNYVAATRQAG
jgi:hypothetical protein